MEYRHLGTSGLKVPVISLGAGTFGGSGPLFGAWGNTEGNEARRLVDICLEAGVNMFDTADVYSNGASETVLGDAIKGRRSKILLSTKMGLPMGDGPRRKRVRPYRRLQSIGLFSGRQSAPSSSAPGTKNNFVKTSEPLVGR
jgi:aryl-alcohol dehydrogenase-like predicted oxidoreductase